MANLLPRSKQIGILNALVEGCSVRSTERMVGVSRETVLSLLVRVGEGCAELLDDTMRDLPCERIEMDEIWAFVQKKQRHVTQDEHESDAAMAAGVAPTLWGMDELLDGALYGLRP